MVNFKRFSMVLTCFGLLSGCSTHKMYEPQVYLDGYTRNIIKYHHTDNLIYKKESNLYFNKWLKAKALKNKQYSVK